MSDDITLSRFISFVLRHKPSAIDLEIDSQGYVEVSKLIRGMSKVGHIIDLPTLERIVDEDDKNRYSFSRDGSKIRANQGHSIRGLNLDLILVDNIDKLYHGTANHNVCDILAQGIKPMQREYVHLTDDIEVAVAVGKRYGDAIVLEVDTKAMIRDGLNIYKSTNGVFLTKYVSPYYLTEYIFKKDD